MKNLLSFVIIIFVMGISPSHAKSHHAPIANSFTLEPMNVRPDGAILTWATGGVIDPYFPTKALLLAQDNGMDISELGTRWVEWMLARQDESGLFGRYCYKEDQAVYETCAIADADDAMMAMWVELLYRLAPRGGLPEAWAKSAEKAQYQLDSIFDSSSTVFFVSKAMHAGLLMDNIEIYAAYKNIERNALRIGANKTAKSYSARAEYLKNGIIPTFWDQKNTTFKASTQTRTDAGFYPDTVVQLIPMMYKFSSPSVKQPRDFYAKWMKNHRGEWFALIGKDYPWGLLAVVAMQQNDAMTANCWLRRSAPFRHGEQWNVLDEAAFQVVQKKLKKKWKHELPACSISTVSDKSEKTGANS